MVRRLAAVVLLVAGAAGCDKKGAPASGPAGAPGGAPRPAASFPVEVAPVESRRVEYTVTAVGSVEAFEKVQVTARVAGVVERMRFAEGDVVRAQQVLVEIEPLRYRLAAQASRASIDKVEAAQAEAKAGLERREQATTQNPGLIRGEEMETWRTKARTSAAELAQARTALEQANLNLRDAFVRAPLAGAIETRTVQTGQYVQPGTVLATLVRRDPLLVRFRIPEPDAVRVRPGMIAKFRVRDDERDFSSKIAHVAQVADEQSRMVMVTAEVDPQNREQLRPGSFAEITVPVGTARDAPVIPQTAVRPSERGFLAYVVENDAARERTLALGMRTADGRVEVRAGLAAGERLVIRGAEALRDGVPVRVSSRRADAAVGDGSTHPASSLGGGP